MSVAYPFPRLALFDDLDRTTMGGIGRYVIGSHRLGTDPLFLADVTLENIAIGSRYWIARSSDLSVVLASGTAASTSEVVANVPAYANPMQIEVRVRKSSAAPKYQPYTTSSFLVRDGVTVFIFQTSDEVAS